MTDGHNDNLRFIEQNIIARLKKSIIGILIVFALGTFYYWLFEDLSFVDALFFTGITISTVGYSMPKSLSTFGKFFTLILIFAGLSIVLYSVSYITALFVEGDLIRMLRHKRLERKVSRLREHVIVVGVGNIGIQVIHQLIRIKEPVVAVDNAITEEKFSEKIFSNNGEVTFIEGDATMEDVLLKAGVKNARALVTTLPDDAMNVFVTLTAKNLNPSIYVVSNISNLNNLTKFIYAGVDHPVATAEIAGVKMVEALAFKKKNEDVIDVLNIKDKTFRVETLDVKGTKLCNKRIEELKLKENYNIYIVGLIKNDEFILGPSKNDILYEDCRVVIFGEDKGIEVFRKDYLQ